MITILHWKKAPFSTSSRIYSAEGEIGQLREQRWNQAAYGELNNKRCQFRTNGFFKRQTEIVDPDTNYIVGKIEYHSWKRKAEITYLDQNFHWKYDNAWQTKWSISDEKGSNFSFEGRSVRGTIEGVDITEYMVLTGLFVSNYYYKATVAIMVAIFIPLIVTLTN